MAPVIPYEPFWRCEGKLTERHRWIADRLDEFVQAGLITAYRFSGVWVIQVDGEAVSLGASGTAESFIYGVTLVQNHLTSLLPVVR